MQYLNCPLRGILLFERIITVGVLVPLALQAIK